MSQRLRVLLVEDSENDALLVLRELIRGGYDVTHQRVDTAETMRQALDQDVWDIVISDYSMPQFSAPAALELLRASGQDLPFILVSGSVGEDIAVAALKAGAHDFIPKASMQRLLPAVARELDDAATRGKRQQAEARLRESIQTLAAVFTASPLPIIAVDRQQCVTRWNRAAERVFGWSADDVVGRPLPNLTPAERDDDDARIRRLLQGVLVLADEVTRARKDGQRLQLTLSSSVLRSAYGNINEFMTIVTDLTEQRRLEEQFRQAQKMEAVGRLAGGIAHDFNNVLTAIAGFTSLVLADLTENDPHRPDLEEVLAASARASAFTRQLLTFSRKQVVQLQPLSLDAVAGELKKLLDRMIGQQTLLRLTLSSGGQQVMADRGQLEQVIMNLVVNAWDAMPRGGTIRLITQSLDLTAGPNEEHEGLPSGEYVLLVVSDDGEGIPADVMDHIFEPFFTTKEAGKGTGLGLSTVYGIVKQIGGELRVRSEPGIGSTFYVYLPVTHQVAIDSSSDAKPTDRAALVGAHILIVEDDAAIRNLIRRTLAPTPHRVEIVEFPADALAYLAQHPVDLLLTDVMLPQMSGPELAERACQLRPGLHIMYTSGYSEEELSIPANNVFLEKPFTPRDLLRKLNEAIALEGQDCGTLRTGAEHNRDLEAGEA